MQDKPELAGWRGYDVSALVALISHGTLAGILLNPYPDVCHVEWAFYQLCVPQVGPLPRGSTWYRIDFIHRSVCVCVCIVLNMCVLWEVRFSWCLPVNSSFLPPGPVCCLIGCSDTGHLCFHPPPVRTHKPPLFDHFAPFDWHVCSNWIMVKGRGEIR